MKNFKKLSVLLLAALMLTVSAAACSKDKDDSSESSKTSVSVPAVDDDDSEEAEESENENPSDSADIIGKWNMVFDEDKFDEVFSSYTEEERNMSKALISMVQQTFDFKDNGTVVCTMTSLMGGDDNSIESTWTQDGDIINVKAASQETSNGSFGIQEITMKLEGNKLIPVSEELSLKVVHFEKA